MSENDLQQQPIIAFGVNNIGCDQRGATFQTIVHSTSSGSLSESVVSSGEDNIEATGCNSNHDGNPIAADGENGTFFINNLDLQKLKSGISAMWSKEMGMNNLAAISGKLLSNQNEWWVFYVLFDRLKWYKKKPTQKEFCEFMTDWFKRDEYEHIKPCTVYDFKKLDNYIKKTKCDSWDVDAESYRGQRQKLKEFIFIRSILEKEFTNEKYLIP